jgi:hypothetical protein
MRMKIIFIMMLLTIGLAFAANNEFPEFSNASLQGTCTSPSYGACPVGTGCNISMKYPNDTIMLNNVEVQTNLPFWNYTILNMTPSGKYPTVVTCCFNSSCNISSYVVSVFSSTRIYGTLEFDSCPENITENYTMIGIAIFLFVILFISFMFRIWWLQLISGLGIFAASFMIMACSLIFSILGIVIGLIIMITAIMKAR